MVLDTQADKMLAELSACVQKTGPHLHSRCWLPDVYGLKENELGLGMIHTESLRLTHLLHNRKWATRRGCGGKFEKSGKNRWKKSGKKYVANFGNI